MKSLHDKNSIFSEVSANTLYCIFQSVFYESNENPWCTCSVHYDTFQKHIVNIDYEKVDSFQYVKLKFMSDFDLCKTFRAFFLSSSFRHVKAPKEVYIFSGGKLLNVFFVSFAIFLITFS